MKILGKNFPDCECKEAQALHSIPAHAYFRGKRFEKVDKNLRLLHCQKCQGYKVLESETFEPSLYDLPQHLFNVSYLLTLGRENQSLRYFAQEISKERFLFQKSVGPKKLEEMEKVMKMYGIEWK